MTYEQLTHGLAVHCEINGTKITDAKISVSKTGDKYICQNEKDVSFADDTLGYKYSHFFHKSNMENFKITFPVKTWDNLTIGDIIVDTDGDESEVLAVTGKVFLRSLWGNFTSASSWYTKSEAQQDGWTIKQSVVETTVPELTVAEISEKLGYEIKIKK